MIAVVDYKAGNLTSVMKSLVAIAAEDVRLTDDPEAVRVADKIILPGVGHFSATRTVADTGLADAIRARTALGVPFLGICVGLQWLFAGSTEAPETPGLGAFPGECSRFDDPALKCPHVGWNRITVTRPSPLTEGLEEDAFVYYTHSFRAPVVQDTVAVTEYGTPFTAIVSRGNLHGVQFHPEKSGEAGLRLLANFVRG